ncbi:heterokaryon incompatibility protein-domain-containing protein [Sordaria sp. MPI-SDFR-AT-0083]|nr:heterokaryon incompatibility protein-domain-containing protein [Sordaria sp. MPI-SDFR-AT-0083]
MATTVEPRPLNTLCQKCQLCFPLTGPWAYDNETKWCITTGDSSGWHLRSFTIDDLDDSIAAEGCHLCRVFLDSLLPKSMIMGNYHDYPGWRARHKHFWYELIHWVSKKAENGHYLQIRDQRDRGISVERIPFKAVFPARALPHDERANSDQVWTIQAGSVLFRDQDVLPSPVVISQPFSSTTFDPLVLAQVKRWVDECTREHEACSSSSAASQLIRSESQTKVRFIDIGFDESATIHLVEQGMEERAKYITLSHRWTADTSMATLTSSNKAAYFTAIPTENWPKIYKDAVFLSRFLGIRYVWIDSLCIIQDDRQDWSVQASLMHRIYAHGYLNLAGVCGEFSGLELTRDPRSISPCIIPRVRPNDVQEYWACYTDGSPALRLKHTPLYSRGWCYQERFLSTRTIHFSQQLYWECRTRQASETFGWSTTNEHPDLITTSAQAADQSHLQSVVTGSTMDPSELWGKIITGYSETEFTEYSDRLAALRGIFSSFWERFDGSMENDWCVAGLWKKYLTRQLLWQFVHRGTHGLLFEREEFDRDQDADYYMRMETELANFPSWSWASCPTSPRSSFISFLPLHLFNVDISKWMRYEYSEDLVECESMIPLNRQALEEGFPAFESAAMILLGSFSVSGSDYGGMFRDENRWDSHHYPIRLDRPLLRAVQAKDLRVLPILLRGSSSTKEYRFCVEGIFAEALGMRDGIPTFRRLGLWHDVYSHSSQIPGLPEYSDSGESTGSLMEEFRKRRQTLPKHRYMLV